MRAEVDNAYIEELHSLSKVENRPIFLFGCGDLGKCAIEVFNKIGIPVMGYIDNDMEKIHKKYMDKEVYSLEEVRISYSNSVICVCIFNESIELKIKEQLQAAGFKEFIDNNKIIDLYFQLHIKPMAYKIEEDKIVAVNSLAVIITEKCSLRCKYCAHFIPYRKEAGHFKKDEIINEIKAAAEIIDEIKNLSLYGGEGFLHPELKEICSEIMEIENIKEVTLLTNGTIIPSKEFMETISKNKKFVIHVSDYGIHNCKKDIIEKLCKEYGVKYILMNGYDTWLKPPKLEKHNRSYNENRAVYLSCKAPEICPMIINGKLYKCGTAVIGERMGWIPESHEDIINLLDVDKTVYDKKEQLRKFILSNKPMKACDYCVTEQAETIPIAEQLTSNNNNLDEIF